MQKPHNTHAKTRYLLLSVRVWSVHSMNILQYPWGHKRRIVNDTIDAIVHMTVTVEHISHSYYIKQLWINVAQHAISEAAIISRLNCRVQFRCFKFL